MGDWGRREEDCRKKEEHVYRSKARDSWTEHEELEKV